MKSFSEALRGVVRPFCISNEVDGRGSTAFICLGDEREMKDVRGSIGGKCLRGCGEILEIKLLKWTARALPTHRV